MTMASANMTQKSAAHSRAIMLAIKVDLLVLTI